MCHTPIVNWDLNVNLSPFFFDLTMKHTPKMRGRYVPLNNIGVGARPMVAFSGFNESHKPPPLGDVRGIAKWPAKGGVFCIVVLLIVALAAPRAIHSE